MSNVQPSGNYNRISVNGVRSDTWKHGTELLTKMHSTSAHVRSVVVEVSRSDLKPGKLAALFSQGTRAVILSDDDRVGRIWDGLQPTQHRIGETIDASGPFWDEGLITLARNHRDGDLFVGDMLRFTQNTIGHIARKTTVFPDPLTGEMETIPQAFWRGDDQVRLPDTVTQTSWELITDVLRSSLPATCDIGEYAASVEQLKYPTDADLDMILTLLADSSGGFARLGRKIDRERMMLRGPFALPKIRELLALTSLIPGVRHLVSRMNAFWVHRDEKDIPRETRIIGAAHVDGSKFVTALASDRDVLRTQVRDGDSWYDLPLTTRTLAIFPSEKLSLQCGIEPTTHRILIKTNRDESHPITSNVTMSLCVVERPRDSDGRGRGHRGRGQT